MDTVALEGLIILEDPTLVNQALLIRGYITIVSNRLLEGSDGGIEANLNGKLGTIGTADVDVDFVCGVPLCGGTLSGSVITSHVVRPKHGGGGD